MATYTVANITDITGNADWTFDGSNNQIGAPGVGLDIGAPAGGPVADSVNISGSYLINNVSVTSGFAPLASPTFTGTVTAPILDVTGAATFSTTLAVTGSSTLSGGLAVTGVVNTTGGFEIGGNSIYASPALTGVPTVPTASPGTNTTQAASCAFVQTAVAAPSSPNTNKLINPFMEIDQANEGASVSLTSGSPSYIVDGWTALFTSAVGAGVAAQRVTDAPTGYPYSLKVTVSTGGTLAAGSLLFCTQILEADNLIDTGFGSATAQSLALTFWLKSSIAGVYSAALRNEAATRSYPFNVTLSAANTWQKFTIVVPGDTGGTWLTSGNVAALTFSICATAGSTFQGTANSWQFANVLGTASNTNSVLSTSGATFQIGPTKLEVSTTATPIVRTSIQQEFANCQRYYAKSYNLGTAVGSITASSYLWYVQASQLGLLPFALPVPMRIVPNVTLYSSQSGLSGRIFNVTTASDITGSTAASGNTLVFVPQPGTAPTGTSQLEVHWTADARL